MFIRRAVGMRDRRRQVPAVGSDQRVDVRARHDRARAALLEEGHSRIAVRADDLGDPGRSLAVVGQALRPGQLRAKQVRVREAQRQGDVGRAVAGTPGLFEVP
jgi:hypothetical protein